MLVSGTFIHPDIQANNLALLNSLPFSCVSTSNLIVTPILPPNVFQNCPLCCCLNPQSLSLLELLPSTSPSSNLPHGCCRVKTASLTGGLALMNHHRVLSDVDASQSALFQNYLKDNPPTPASPEFLRAAATTAHST